MIKFLKKIKTSLFFLKSICKLVKIFKRKHSNTQNFRSKLDKQTKYRRNIQKHLYFAGELSCADLSELINKSVPLTS